MNKVNSMRFHRKIQRAYGAYGTISLPKPISDLWVGINDVELSYDPTGDTIIVKPCKGGKA